MTHPLMEAATIDYQPQYWLAYKSGEMEGPYDTQIQAVAILKEIWENDPVTADKIAAVYRGQFPLLIAWRLYALWDMESSAQEESEKTEPDMTPEAMRKAYRGR